MNYTQQYHEQFNRIWGLIQEYLPQRFLDFSLIQHEWVDYDIFEKINILAPIFTTKDDKGEWILKEGDNVNPKFSTQLEYYEKKIQPFITEHHDDPKFEEFFIRLGVQTGILHQKYPQTLRDLFRANCIPANDEEQDKKQIENLELIKW